MSHYTHINTAAHNFQYKETATNWPASHSQ